jgi:hypothetical protein
MRRLLAALLVAGALLVPAAPATAQASGCTVDDATLTWGFKESFRAYIDGSIANGEWTVADGATYETPSFGFPGGSGLLTGRPLEGQVDFPGSVRFTGHGGILDTTVANPVLVFRGDDDAVLLLDVSGPTMEGDQVSVTATPFVSVDLSGQDLAVAPDGTITIDEAPTALTADGEAAFPNYPAGTEFDPISATLSVGDCAFTDPPIDVGEGVIGDATPFFTLVAVLGGVLALAVVVLVAWAIRRRILGA